MRSVFYVRAKHGWLIILLCFIFLASWFLYYQPSLPTGGGYVKYDGFPPLVYLPDYTQGPRVSADAAILVETTSGAVLFAKNEHRRRAPASTTKMMTAIVVLEKTRPNEIVTVSRRAAGTRGSTLRLRAGDRIRLSELLQGVMLCSGNDGSVALAEHVAGTEAAFSEMMNMKAIELGALHTRFQNAHGLRAPSHYSTAFDLAIIARYAMAYPRFAEFVKTKEEAMEWEASERTRPIRNTNRLLWSFAGADGIKTGTTNEAGYCLVASATREGRRFIAVVLHSPDRWGDCARLLEYGFNNFTLRRIAKADVPIGKVTIQRGNPKQVGLFPRRDMVVVVRRGQEGMYRKFVTIYSDRLIAPIRRGTVLGRIGYAYQGSEVEGVDLLGGPSSRHRPFWNRRRDR